MFEKNMTVGFRAEFNKPDDDKAFLKITGSSLYRIYLNNEFIGHGPARAGHGYYRVDEWDLSKHLIEGENISPAASCNHGFASHVVHVLYRDVLGIADVDQVNKIVRFQMSDVGLDFCKGQIPLGKELVKFEWKKTGDEIKYEYDVPEGYEVEIIK